MSLVAHRISPLADELRLASRYGNPHAVHEALEDDERSVLHWLEDKESVVAADATTELERSEEEVEEILGRLHGKGLVYRETKDGKPSYQVSKYHSDVHKAAHAETPEREELRQGLISGMSKYVAMQMLSLGLTYLTQVLLARWFGSSVYGSYSLAATFATVLAYVAALGFPVGGLQRYLPQYAKDEKWGLFKGLLNQSTQLSLFAGAILAIIAGPALWYGSSMETALKAAFVIAAILVPIEAASQVFASVFQSLKRFVASYFSDQVFIPIVFLAAVFVVRMTTDQLSVWHLVLIALAVHGVSTTVQVIWLRGTLPPPLKSATGERDTRAWLKTSLPLLMATLLGVIVYRADLLVVGWLLSSQEAGIYAAVLTTAEVFAVFFTAANNSSTPSIGPLFAKKEMGTLQYLMSRAALYSFVPALLGTVACAAAASQILGLFGDGFEAGRNALLVLLGAQIVKAAAGSATMLVVMAGLQMRVAQIFLASAVIDVALLMILVPRYGLVGASIASFVAISTTQIVLSVLAAKHAKIQTSIFGVFKVPPADPKSA